MHAQGLAKRGAAGEGGYMAECTCTCDKCRYANSREAAAIQTAARYRTAMAQAAHALAGDVNKETVIAGIWATLRQGEAAQPTGQPAGQEGEGEE